MEKEEVQEFFDIVSIPMIDCPEKERAVEKLNYYFTNDWIKINEFEIVQDGIVYLSVEVVNPLAKKNRQVYNPSASASIAQVSNPQSSSALSAPGLAVPFADTITGHKKQDANDKPRGPKLEEIYRNDKDKLYIYYTVACERIKKAIEEKVQIFNFFSNEALRTIIDNKYRTKEELKNVAEFKGNQYNKSADFLVTAMASALSDVEKGITDEMLKNKEKEWHALVKEHKTAIKE